MTDPKANRRMCGCPPPDRPAVLYTADAAAHLGLARSTWSDYYSDGRTPGAIETGPSTRPGHPKRADGIDHDGGHVRPYWHPATLDNWQRPGRGAGGGRKPKEATT